METLIPTTNALTYMQALHFIHQYRAFEQLPLEEGQRLLRHLAINEPDHVCDHWRYKKRSFGAFFLNADMDLRVSLMQHFGINSHALEEYKRAKQDRSYEAQCRNIFLPEPQELRDVEALLMFFVNHGISTVPAPGLQLDRLPRKSKQYGNSSNWADYILAMEPVSKRRVVMEIVGYYESKRRVAA